ncbi:hypothetical protein ACS0TY_033350 [Phlomoides rotata]
MAYKITCAFFLIALILFTTSTPLSHAQLLSVSVTGRLCCSATGNCPGVGPIPGVVVRLICLRGGLVTQTTTDANGRYNITASNVLGNLPLNQILNPCVVAIRLPLNNTICPILSNPVNTGTLIGLIVPQSIFGFLVRFIVGIYFKIQLLI